MLGGKAKSWAVCGATVFSDDLSAGPRHFEKASSSMASASEIKADEVDAFRDLILERWHHNFKIPPKGPVFIFMQMLTDIHWSLFEGGRCVASTDGSLNSVTFQWKTVTNTSRES